MTLHSTALEAERPMPAGDTIKDLLPDTHDKGGVSQRAPAPAVTRKFNFRKMLMAGAAVAVLAGAAWYGWDYWAGGQYLVSTPDRYVKAAKPPGAPQNFGF